MKIEVRLSEDGMTAGVTLLDDGIRYDITAEEILQALKEAGVKYGIDMESVKELALHPVFDREVIVARGKPPIDGRDGTVVITKRSDSNTTVSKGKVDLRELAARGRIIVRKGEVVGRLTKPTPGTPGMNVMGERVPPKAGSPPKTRIGKNLKVDEEGRIIAQKDGILRITEDQVFVEEMLEIRGDVDYSTGNVDFPGTVVVRGDVKPGFVVRARGDVTVQGIVEAATIISHEGNVFLSGVKGQEKGMIRAGKSVKAKFLESAHVEARENVEVEGPITNSVVKSGDSVKAVGRRGVIVGGMITALREISAEEIGSPIGVKTVLEIGFDPELRDRERVLSAQIKLDEENLEKLTLILKDLLKMKERSGGVIPEDKKELYKKVTQTVMYLRESIERNKEELQKIREEQRETRKEAKIVARKMIHPGVVITIFQREFRIDKPLKSVILMVDEKEDKIRVHKYSG